MRWTLINGSPRGRRSNTLILLERLAQGLTDTGHSTELLHIALPTERALAVERWTRAERLLLGFPLYADAMPGQVMELFEALEGTCARPNPAPIAFLVQSGFPEPGQSRAIERWLGLFAKRLGARPIGTIVKGGLFGLQTLPARKTREILQCFEELGRQLGASDRLDPKVLRKLCGPDWFPRWLHPVVQRREFRHSAHNALFWTNIAALAASSILGIASSRARGQSDLDSAHRLAIAMTATGFVSFGAVVLDVALFGGHDNATIIGPKIAF